MNGVERYRHLVAQGRCPRCGKPNDQQPYVYCRHCYIPAPPQRLFPGVSGDDPQWNVEYRWLLRQERQQPIEVGCCGQWQSVEQVPFACPHCGRVYFQEAGK